MGTERVQRTEIATGARIETATATMQQDNIAGKLRNPVAMENPAVGTLDLQSAASQ